MTFYRKHERRFAPVDYINPGTGEVIAAKRRVKQSFKAECDINNILKQYKKSGMVRHIAANQPRYENLPDPMEFQDALEAVRRAQESFASLPSKVRASFDNDPSQLLAALHNPETHDQLRELGILKALPAEPEPPPAPPVPEPSPAPTNGATGGSKK